ncbi:MAG: cyclic nucleotide-binding domain-containing protein [Pseudomonadota bacterium]
MALDILDDKLLQERYLCAWDPDKVLFQEGDTSQDLYILISGRLEVLKSEQKIDEISSPGSLFGEMSWLLGKPRTATVKAKESSRALCIPRQEIEVFLHDHPQAGQDIGRHLARRLEQTTQVVFGLKELCDHLPDAVILSDAQGRITAFNSAAAQLYGRDWGQMQGRPAEEVYQEPEEYRDFLAQVMSASSARERVLTISHPTRGQRLISTSMTAIMDQQRQVQGLISLGRDITKMERLRRLNRWLLPLLALLALLSLGGNWLLPHIWQNSTVASRDGKLFESQIAKDYLLLSTLLKNNFTPEAAPQAIDAIKRFLAAQQVGGQGPYTGVILLDTDKKVLTAYSRLPEERPAPPAGSTYANLLFQGPADSLHKVVVLYRPSPRHPGGLRSVEMALEVAEQGRPLGWLLLPLDLDFLQANFGLDEQALTSLRFARR